MTTVDVLIIGAGPAGLSTALHLVSQDPSWADRLIVLERAAHPRPKLCGGAVTRLGLDILRHLKLPAPLPIPQAPVEDIRFVYGRRVVHVRNRPEFIVYHRPEFDAYLAAVARRRGVRLEENVPVEAVRFHVEGATVTTPRGAYHAHAAVGADGSKGLTRQLVPRRQAPSRVARLIEVTARAPETAPPFQERFAVFDFTPVREHLQGYVWDFPSRVNGAPCFNRGVYDARFYPAYPRASLPDTLAEAWNSWEGTRGHPELAGHPIHWFSPRATFARPHLLLAGDAAGVDPLFGEGIAPALAYGEVAARTLRSAFQTGDFSFRRYRRRLLTSRLGRYLLVRWVVAWWGYRFSRHPLYMHALWSLGQFMAGINTARVALRGSANR